MDIDDVTISNRVNLVYPVRKSGRGPGIFSHVSDVTDTANYANVGVM